MDATWVLQYVKKLGYAIFTSDLYNMNMIAIRNPKGTADAFDDQMVLVYRDEGGWVERWWTITTDPGLYYLMDKSKWLDPKGVAVIKEGQYRGAYQIGLHGNYEALVQTGGPVTVWRDADLDNNVDTGSNECSGYLGINIHCSNSTPYAGDQTATKVGAWSAGCIVFANETEFRSYMATVKKQIEYHPTWTKYTLTVIKAPSF